MEKQFQISIYKPSVILSSLTDLISEHNSSERKELWLEDIQGYIKCQSYRFHMRKLVTEIIMDELVVLEDGENLSFIIKEKVMVELEKENEEKEVSIA
jgi:hypothetical protein